MTNSKILLEIYNVDRKRIIQYLIHRYKITETVAEDICQDVFAKLSTNIEDIKSDYSEISGLVWKSCKNKCIDYIRHDSKLIFDSNIVNDVLTSMPCTVKSVQRNIDIKKILSTLNKRDSMLIDMFYFKNLSIDDISKSLNMSRNSVKVQLHRIRNKLRKICSDEYRHRFKF